MNRENIHDWLRGPVVAVATPFKEDFSLDLAALQDNIRFMIEGGVRTGDGVLLVGAAGGEFPSLNADERKAIMDASIEAAQGQVPIMTSIQHTDFRVILDLANYAEEAGVAAAQLGQLYYYPSTERDIYNLFRLVADHSGITLMVYHTPWDGIHMSRELLTRLTSIPHRGGNQVGLGRYGGLPRHDSGLQRQGGHGRQRGPSCTQPYVWITGVRDPSQRFLATVSPQDLAPTRSRAIRRRTCNPRCIQVEVVGLGGSGSQIH